MADFKTHISVGSVVGLVLALLSFIAGWATHIYVAIIAFFTTIIGSFMPDLDSDSGLPVTILFWLHGLLAAALTFYFMYENNMALYYAIPAGIGSFALVHFVIHPLFKKYTQHRGIFHSTPAFLISFFASLLIADLFRKITTLEKFTLALSLALGYLCHLLLDEIYATSFLFGNSKSKKKKQRKKKFSLSRFLRVHFLPKQSFGTAIDLGLDSKSRAFVIYAILLILIYLTYPVAKDIYYNLF